MSHQKELTRAILVLFVLIVASSAALYGVNGITSPIIESNNNSQQFSLLYSVMPDAAGFEKLYEASAADQSALTDIPETVQSIYSETSGKGYALRLSTTKGYTGNAIEITMAVDTEGKISGVEITAYPETKDFSADYPQTYIGQDSTLADVELAAGVTYSSSAFKNAVSDGFAALVSNQLITAGVMSADQAFEQMLPKVYPGMANQSGMLQYEEQQVGEGQFTYITRIMKAMNETGYAYFVTEGENTYLAIYSLAGSVRLYDTAGAELSADPAYAEMIAEVKAHASSDLEIPSKAKKKLRKMLSDEAEYTWIMPDGVFNSVLHAFEIQDGGNTYYGFMAVPYGYNNLVMECYYVLDESGAIVSMNVDELIFFPEYFTDYELEEDSYKAGFAGLTAETFTGEQALITGATFSADGVSTATADVFETFRIIQENGGVANE